jgi:phosphatidylcholine synthase
MAAAGDEKIRHESAGLAARVNAFSVHVFTASGAALALLALIAATRADWPQMFWWLGVALIVDGIDGTLARRTRVAELLPRWSGDVLDFVVDFATYILIPAYAIAASGLLPALLAVPLSLAIVVTGALYCADRRMKTEDNYFLGFPALWNVVAFYLFLLKPDPWIAATGIFALTVLTFIPFPFIHPFRVARLRAVSICLLAAWSILAVVTLLRDFEPGAWVTMALSAIGLYFLLVGLLRRIAQG